MSRKAVPNEAPPNNRSMGPLQTNTETHHTLPNTHTAQFHQAIIALLFKTKPLDFVTVSAIQHWVDIVGGQVGRVIAMIPVDVIFLDMDGVLLPFGSAKKSSQDEANKCDDCIFPNSTMQALTVLLQKVGEISLTIKDGNNKQQTIKGNPVLVLSSTSS